MGCRIRPRCRRRHGGPLHADRGEITFTLTEKGWELYNTTAVQTAQADTTIAADSSSSATQTAQPDTAGELNGLVATADGQGQHRLLVINPKDSGGTVNYRPMARTTRSSPGWFKT